MVWPTCFFPAACSWLTSEAIRNLIGRPVNVLRPGIEDQEFPYACAAGFYGGADFASQRRSTCKGRCPEGFRESSPLHPLHIQACHTRIVILHET